MMRNTGSNGTIRIGKSAIAQTGLLMMMGVIVVCLQVMIPGDIPGVDIADTSDYWDVFSLSL